MRQDYIVVESDLLEKTSGIITGGAQPKPMSCLKVYLFAAVGLLVLWDVTGHAARSVQQATGQDDGGLMAELGGATIPAYSSMASLQEALHTIWVDGEDTAEATQGRSLLRRRKKDSDDEDEEENDNEDKDDDDDEDEDDDDDEEEDDDNDDDNGDGKKKRRRMKSKGTTKLLGVQLDMTMLTAPGAGNDDEDDDGRRRRQLRAAAAAAAAKVKPSTELLEYASKTPSHFPDGWLVNLGKLPRSEAEAGCKNVAGGKVEFSIDLKKMLQADGVDDGDDVSPLKVVHHLRCTVPDPKDKAKMAVNPDIKAQHFFVVVTIKSIVVAVDCAIGATDCIVWGSQKALPKEAVTKLKQKSRRRLLAAAGAGGKGGPTFRDTLDKPIIGAVRGETYMPAVRGIVGEAKEIMDSPRKDTKFEIFDDQSAEMIGGGYSEDLGHGYSREAVVKRTRPPGLTGAAEFTYNVCIKGPDNQVLHLSTVVEQQVGCFPAAARVMLSNGAQVPMHQLRHGDSVLAVLPSGHLAFSEVYLFGHKDADAHANFIELQTAINATLLVTPDHYIHIIPRSKAATARSLSWADTVHTRAGKVQPGDVMVHVSRDDSCAASEIVGHKNSSCGSLQYVTVTSVKTQVAKGLYNPYTMIGNIVVEDFIASSHSGLDFLDPLTGTGPYVPYVHQVMLSPLRFIHRLYPSLMAHVDNVHSRNAWASAGVTSVMESIMQYHLKGPV